MPRLASVGGRSGSLTYPYNIASGGSEQTIANYLGTGNNYRVHTFTSNTTFSVPLARSTFRVLVVGGGGNGNNGGNPGQGGQVVENLSLTIPAGSHAISIGGAGGTSSIGSVVSASGGASAGSSAGGGTSSSVSGTSQGYAGNGGQIWWNYCCPATENGPGPGGGTSLSGSGAATYYGGGGGGMQHTATNGTQIGYQGIIIVAYRILP